MCIGPWWHSDLPQALTAICSHNRVGSKRAADGQADLVRIGLKGLKKQVESYVPPAK